MSDLRLRSCSFQLITLFICFAIYFSLFWRKRNKPSACVLFVQPHLGLMKPDVTIFGASPYTCDLQPLDGTSCQSDDSHAYWRYKSGQSHFPDVPLRWLFECRERQWIIWREHFLNRIFWQMKGAVSPRGATRPLYARRVEADLQRGEDDLVHGGEVGLPQHLRPLPEGQDPLVPNRPHCGRHLKREEGEGVQTRTWQNKEIQKAREFYLD